jgi:hypothetical protein
MNKTQEKVGSKRAPLVAAIGGVVASVIASIACIGPIAAALTGLGSSGVFGWALPWRGFAMLASLVCFALGFYLTYRSRECNKRGRTNRNILWGAASLTLTLYFFEFITLPLLG